MMVNSRTAPFISKMARIGRSCWLDDVVTAGTGLASEIWLVTIQLLCADYSPSSRRAGGNAPAQIVPPTTAFCASGPILTLGFQASGESAHQINVMWSPLSRCPVAGPTAGWRDGCVALPDKKPWARCLTLGCGNFRAQPNDWAADHASIRHREMRDRSLQDFMLESSGALLSPASPLPMLKKNSPSFTDDFDHDRGQWWLAQQQSKRGTSSRHLEMVRRRYIPWTMFQSPFGKMNSSRCLDLQAAARPLCYA